MNPTETQIETKPQAATPEAERAPSLLRVVRAGDTWASRWSSGPARELAGRKMFWVFLALKLALGSMLASHYLRDLFVPFVNYFVESGFKDPWAHFSALGRFDSFPYPPVMLYVLALPRWLFGPLLATGTDTVTWAHLLVMRLPLLAADLGIALVLCHWYPGRSRRIVAFYWCSPLILYVAYWHGQLDIIPTAIFVLSLFLLRQHRLAWAMVVFGLALATKTHLWVALPFLLAYIRQESNTQKTLRAAAVALGTCLMAMLPFAFHRSFEQMVFGTQEQARLVAFQMTIGRSDMAVLIAPAAILLLWFRFIAYRQRNWDLLMLYFGILFSVFMLLAPPAPGYVLWSLPFLVHFVCRGRQTDSLPFVCFSFAYVAFFCLRPGSDLFDAWRSVSPAITALGARFDHLLAMNQAAADLFSKASFTVMQASLAGMILFMHVVGVRRNEAHRASESPTLVGVAGDSGAGKDSFSQLVKEALGEERITVVAGDDYHRWPRGHEMWQVYTHLDVRANNLYRQHEHALAFSQGNSVIKGTYDHGSGRFTEERFVDPSEVMLFQGLHTLSVEGLRRIYDLKIFLNPDEDLRRLWKVQRDLRERGHQQADVLRAIESRQRDREAYVLPQMQEADIVVRWTPAAPIDPSDPTTAPELKLAIVALNSFDFTALVDDLQRCSALSVQHVPFSDSQWQSLDLSGTVLADELHAGARRLQDALRPLRPALRLRNGLAGCLQLIFLTALAQRAHWRSQRTD